MATSKPAGLEGIVAGDTEICSVAQGDLIYRGYQIDDLAENATFEAVAYLLLEGHKPFGLNRISLTPLGRDAVRFNKGLAKPK